MRYAVVFCLVAACGDKKLDRAEVDRIVETADRCAKEDDLMCVIHAEKHMSELVGRTGKLGKDDEDYLSAATKRIEADLETAKNMPVRQPK